MRHPIHPMLVHLPLACWLLTPACDGAALALGSEFFWRVSALLSGGGVAFGALAATAGAMDYGRAREKAPKLVLAHASLMGSAWTIALIGLVGRVGGGMPVPPPLWAVAASAVTLMLAIAGAWCGGEMVYGRGIGIAPRDTA